MILAFAVSCSHSPVPSSLARGESIGHKRIRFEPVAVTRIRLRAVRSVAEPIVGKLAVFSVG
jgi:hypothetical protein